MSAQESTDWEQLLFVGPNGFVAGINRITGERQWTTKLEGTGFNIVSLLVDDGVLFAATNGKLFALHPATGELFWENPLKGLKHGHLCMATARSSTDSNTNPIQQAQAQADASHAAQSHGGQ